MFASEQEITRERPAHDVRGPRRLSTKVWMSHAMNGLLRRGMLGWVLLMGGSLANAQTPAPAPAAAPKNLISNGGFERTTNYQNLFDGVDSQNNLRVPTGDFPIFSSGASFQGQSFSCSVNYIDVNGDGIPDLVVAAPDGHLFWYPNIGTKTEPAFDHARLVQTRLGPVPHLSVCDWNEDGKKDILYGSIDGMLYVLPNLGSSADPRWIAEMGKPRWITPHMDHPAFKLMPICHPGGKEPLLVGTYAAPCFADWNKDGLNDMIVGEGSYSANSVHIWLNSGSRNSPVFKTDSRFYLAYGEGREQLTPTVWDWNNDGRPDLIVGDRNGQISLHLGTPESIKDPKKVEPVALTKFLSVGGLRKLDQLVTPYVCDFNGDGIPDLLFGTPRGQIKVALGKGKREDPELGVAKEIKGIDFAKDFKTPSRWDYMYYRWGWWGEGYNFSGLPEIKTVEDGADVKEGKNAFHFSWFEKFHGWAWVPWSTWFSFGEARAFFNGKADSWQMGMFNMFHGLRPFVLGKEYEFSYWVKGNNMKLYTNIYYCERFQDPDKPKDAAPLTYTHNYCDEQSVGGSWKQVKKTLVLQGVRGRTIEFGPNPQDKRTFKTEIDTNNKMVVFWEQAPEPGVTFQFIGNGDIWLDDIKLIEVVK